MSTSAARLKRRLMQHERALQRRYREGLRFPLASYAHAKAYDQLANRKRWAPNGIRRVWILGAPRAFRYK
jgi:hypothetical protein